MNVRMLALAAVLSLTLALAARADDTDPEPSLLSSKTYKSPQAVFDAFYAASEKKDYKATLGCLTPEAQKETAVILAYTVLAMKSSGLEQLDKRYKPMVEVLEKYGLDEKATRDIKVTFGGDAKAQKDARDALTKLIKKPIPFSLDMMKSMEKMGEVVPVQAEKPKYTLADLKTDGDKATGTAEMAYGNIKSKQKVAFSKRGGGWKLIPSFDFNPPEIEVQPKDGRR